MGSLIVPKEHFYRHPRIVDNFEPSLDTADSFQLRATQLPSVQLKVVVYS